MFTVEEVHHDLQKLFRKHGLLSFPTDEPLSQETNEAMKRLMLALADHSLSTNGFLEFRDAEFAKACPEEVEELDRRLRTFALIRDYIPLDASSPEDAIGDVWLGICRRYDLEKALSEATR